MSLTEAKASKAIKHAPDAIHNNSRVAALGGVFFKELLNKLAVLFKRSPKFIGFSERASSHNVQNL